MSKKFINNSKFYIIFSDLFNLFLKNDSKKIVNTIDQIVKLLIKKKKTIILPTFNLNFPKTKKTSYSEDFIQTGFINKYLIKKYDFKRTLRPMYNYAVLGPNSNSILKLKQKTAWGKDSVIGYLVKKNATGLGLGVNYRTFNWVAIHHYEEIYKVPYRYFKIFKGINIDLNLKVSEKMFVRNLNLNLVQNETKLNKILIRKGQIKNFEYKNIKISLLNLKKQYIEAIKLLKKDNYSLVKNEK